MEMASELSLAKGGADDASKARLTALMLLCIVGTIIILLRAAYIQIFTNPKLEKLALRQYRSQSLIRPRRGAILDRNGEPLAVSVEIKSLAANPSKIQDKKMLARTLSRATLMPYKKLLQKINEG